MKTNKDKKTLHLVLKKKWWLLIKSGVKTEEYREVSEYWTTRLMGTKYKRYIPHLDNTINKERALKHHLYGRLLAFRPYEKVCFHLGYTKETITSRISAIGIGKGEERLGALPGKEYFVIRFENATERNYEDL